MPSVRAELLRRHRSEHDGRTKDRIKVVLLYDDGWSYASIAEALFLSEEGVRQQLKDYVESDGKKLKLGNGGSQTFLNITQTKDLTIHLENHLYLKVSDICAYVHKTYGIRYSVSGMTHWLKKQRFTFHQPCGVPARANYQAQEKFIKSPSALEPEIFAVLWPTTAPIAPEVAPLPISWPIIAAVPAPIPAPKNP